MDEGGKPDPKQRLEVQFFAPPPDLAPCFTTFYRLDFSIPKGGTVTDYLQPEWANLRFFKKNPPSAQVIESQEVVTARFTATGPSCKATRFTMGSTSMWGFGLSPLGWARFVAKPANAFANGLWDGEKEESFARFKPLYALLCRSDSDTRTKIEQAASFFRGLAGPPDDEDRILAIHEAMIDPYLLEVGDFAQRTGLTVRTLERLCARYFGFPPRSLLRRQRMMRSLVAFMLSEDKSWTQVIDAHYHDQAHFVHEFHFFMGMSPSEYASMPHPILSAFMEERKRIWGSPVQTLDRPGLTVERPA